MSVGIISRPIKSGSNWNALGNPVVYKIQRQDHPFDQIADNGGFVQLRINGVDVTAYYQVGNTVYYEGAIFATTATITARTFSGGHTLITVDVAYVSTDVGIINNLSKRTDYHVQYSFNSIDDVELLEAELTVSPGNDGMMALSASVLKNLLTPSWSIPETINEPDTGISIGFYLVTQEYYDGALQGSEANDDANPIYGLLAANQIGYAHGSNMLDYYPEDDTKKWLTRFYLTSALSGLRMWRNWPFTLSMILLDTENQFIRILEYDVTGSLVATSSNELDLDESFVNKVNRILIPAVNDATKTVVVKLLEFVMGSFTTIPIPSSTNFSTDWNNDDLGDDWTLGVNAQISTLTSITRDSKILSTAPNTPVTPLDQYLRTNFIITIPNTKNVDVIFYGFAPVKEILFQVLGFVGDGTPTGFQFTTTSPITALKTYTKFGLRVVSNDTVAGTITIDDVSFSYSDVPELLVPITIEVEDACDYNADNIPIPYKNPILLQWHNSNGGDACWLFPMFHEYTYSYQDGRKTRRIMLFDNGLSPVQWEAINELNSPNGIYRPPIIDLENTNTLNYTAKQIGKQVYMVAQDGSTTGVIVIPSNDKVLAKNIKHAIVIEIELPETLDV